MMQSLPHAHLQDKSFFYLTEQSKTDEDYVAVHMEPLKHKHPLYKDNGGELVKDKRDLHARNKLRKKL